MSQTGYGWLFHNMFAVNPPPPSSANQPPYLASQLRIETSIESLSKVYRKPIESLSERRSKLLSKVYRTSVAILSKIRRNSIESLSKVYRTSIYLDLHGLTHGSGVETPTPLKARKGPVYSQVQSNPIQPNPVHSSPAQPRPA